MSFCSAFSLFLSQFCQNHSKNKPQMHSTWTKWTNKFDEWWKNGWIILLSLSLSLSLFVSLGASGLLERSQHTFHRQIVHLSSSLAASAACYNHRRRLLCCCPSGGIASAPSPSSKCNSVSPPAASWSSFFSDFSGCYQW